MTTEGVDYSYGRPDPAKLAAAGKVFACRYLTVVNAQTAGKLLTKPEADKLIAAGVAIVSNFEFQAGDARGGHDAGVRYAKVADEQHRAAGGPPDRPIYFSVDWDASTADLVGPVASYFQGIASVLGVERTGAYGGYRTIDYLLDHKLVAWAWQTYAWSGGRWDARAHIQQYRNGVNVAGADCDLDRATVADSGQWGDEVEMSDLFPKLGDKGEPVKYLQRRLVALGYLAANASIDGVYDADLAAVVKKYRAERLDPTDVGSGNAITGWMVNSMDAELQAKRGKGQKGDPGPAGPAGPPGAPGADGIAPGTVLTLDAHNAIVTAVTPPA